MKKKILICCFLLPLALMMSACQGSAVGAEGPYLGQKPPDGIPALFAPGVVSTGSHELDITMTPDLKEIFFTRCGPDWYSQILCVKVQGGKWTGPFIAPFSSPVSSNYPFVAPDGRRILFEMRVPLKEYGQEAPNANLFVSEKTEGGWSEALPLDPAVNSTEHESFASAAANGNLYFYARYADSRGSFDLYVSEWAESGYRKPVNLGSAVNTEHNEFHPYISPDETFLIFDAQRPDGFGSNDLYVSFRAKDGSWMPAVNLGPEINTQFGDMRPYLSPDSKYLFFCSNRVRSADGTRDRISYEEFMERILGPGNGNQDIYWVDAWIVFGLRPTEQR